MTDLEKRIEWFRSRVFIQNSDIKHLRFIMQHYAEEFYQSKLKKESSDNMSDDERECYK